MNTDVLNVEKVSCEKKSDHGIRNSIRPPAYVTINGC